jgi:hypothetical protein
VSDNLLLRPWAANAPNNTDNMALNAAQLNTILITVLLTVEQTG